MDRALAERMIGAVVLVLLLVVVAPALLDGTPEDGPAPESDQQGGEERTAVIVLNEPAGKPAGYATDPDKTPVERDEPKLAVVPVAPPPADVPEPAPSGQAAPDSDSASSSAAPARPRPAERTEPTVAPPPAAPATGAVPAKPAAAQPRPRGFAVQLGSFSERANAERYAAKLSQQGFAVFVIQARSGQKFVYRVNAGPRPDRISAEKLAAELGTRGYRGMVLALDSNGEGR